MYSRSAEATANDILAKTKDLVSTVANEGYKTTNRYARQFNRAYPLVVNNARSAASTTLTQAQKLAHNAGEHLGHLSKDFGRHAIVAEKQLLRVGFIYIVYKLFVADDQKVYACTQKVKTKIRQHPVESAFLAVGAGIVLGKLFR